MKTLGVYVQISFRASKGSFCNFRPKVNAASFLAAYLASLQHEIELLSHLDGAAGSCDHGLNNQRGDEHGDVNHRVFPSLRNMPVDSVYVGGGTPTLAGAGGLARLFASLRGRLQFDDYAEITIEMTPASADPSL